MNENDRETVKEVLPTMMGALTINTLHEDPEGEEVLGFIAQGLGIDQLDMMADTNLWKAVSLNYATLNLCTRLIHDLARYAGVSAEQMLVAIGAQAAVNNEKFQNPEQT